MDCLYISALTLNLPNSNLPSVRQVATRNLLEIRAEPCRLLATLTAHRLGDQWLPGVRRRVETIELKLIFY